MKKVLITILTVLTALLVCVSCDNSLDADVFTPDPTPEPGAKGIPLTLEFISDGELYIELKYGYSPCDVYYSKNGGDKTLFENLEHVFVNAGDKVAFYRTLSEAKSLPPRFVIHCSSDCYVYGNVMSLIDPDNFATATDVYDHSFAELFAENTHIKNHDSIDLVLPATKLAVGCYNAMFLGCTGLTKAPELPATTLAKACYASMFDGCTGLTTAPALPATTLVDSCYCFMFRGCTSLNKVTCMATTNIDPNNTINWLNGVPTGGNFYKASGASWTTDSDSGIPTGWTSHDAN